MPEVVVDLHDVPEDRTAAHLDHGLGAKRGFLAKTGAEAARQDDDRCVSVRHVLSSMRPGPRAGPWPAPEPVVRGQPPGRSDAPRARPAPSRAPVSSQAPAMP